MEKIVGEIYKDKSGEIQVIKLYEPDQEKMEEARKIIIDYALSVISSAKEGMGC